MEQNIIIIIIIRGLTNGRGKVKYTIVRAVASSGWGGGGGQGEGSPPPPRFSDEKKIVA